MFIEICIYLSLCIYNNTYICYIHTLYHIVLRILDQNCCSRRSHTFLIHLLPAFLLSNALHRQALLDGSSKDHGIKQALLDAFEEQTGLVRHRDCPAIEGLKRETPNLCEMFGSCFCKGIGLQAMLFHKNLVTILKHEFTPPRKPKGGQQDIQTLPVDEQTRIKRLVSNRSLLEDLRIVLRFQQCSSETEGESVPAQGWQAALATMLDLAEEEPAQESPQPSAYETDLWFHVGFVNYTSWYMSMLKLREDVDSEPGLHGDRHKLLVTQEPIASLSVFHFKELLDLAQQWRCTVYKVIDNDDPLELESRLHSRDIEFFSEAFCLGSCCLRPRE